MQFLYEIALHEAFHGFYVQIEDPQYQIDFIYFLKPASIMKPFVTDPLYEFC